MLVSIKWLKDYVDIEASPQEIAEKLTMSGLEVDEIKNIHPRFSGVVVSKILSVKPHPSADRLLLCKVTDGLATYFIVCGAKNISPGDVVPLAKVGAILPDGHVIKSTILRGEKSDGMLCSEAELEVSDDTSGIMQLPKTLPLGTSMDIALKLGDTVLDVNVTPNRSDCLSMLGIAREVAALTGKKLKNPSITFKESHEDIRSFAAVQIIDQDLCPRYTARMIKDIHMGNSPIWIKSRLEAAGLRSINNVVDVTNFVMLEMGQPLHAFDFRFLEGGKIIVRKSRENEEFISLDGKKRILPSGILLICDDVKPVAIGGVMGGLNSEVTDDTQMILLESAYFDPISIRRSSRKLAMLTDAAFRFERGIDPGSTVKALNRAAKLIADLSGGTICKNYIDEYPRKIQTARDIILRVNRIEKIVGIRLPTKVTKKTLKSIGMKMIPKGKGEYLVTPPTWRVDIMREIDLIEEIARLYGYDRIPTSLPSVSVCDTATIPRITLEKRIRHVLTGSGFSEVINYSFENPWAADSLFLSVHDPRRNVVKIKNPLGEDMSIMRFTMINGLMETAKRNINNGSLNLKIFEIGKIFRDTQGILPEETNVLAGLMTGKLSDTFWHFKSMVDFYTLKGAIENILADLKISDCKYFSSETEPFLHPGKSCTILHRDIKIGFLGEIHPELLEKIDVRNKLYVFEINLDFLVEIWKNKKIKFQDLSKFPSIIRDVAVVVPDTTEAGKIIDMILEQKEDLLENVVVFDIYKGKEIPENMKSLGLRFSYRSAEKTLMDSEVNMVHEKIVEKILSQTNAKLRS